VIKECDGMKLLQYPQIDCSEELKGQILKLQNTAWPVKHRTKVENANWAGNEDTYVTSLVLVEGSTAISHVAVLKKRIAHTNQKYLAFGLSEVVTHPDYKRQGYGLQLIREVSRFIESCAPDLSIFTCKPQLIDFYKLGGWFYAEDTCLVGGTYEKPFKSTDLGLATMMRLYSDKAKTHRQDFENSQVYLELKEKQLW
jgi:predicted acetyltransferase